MENNEAAQLEITRGEIAAAKSEVRRAGAGAYVKLARALRGGDARARLRAVPGSPKLLLASRLLAWCKPFLVLLSPLSLLAAPSWWWALAGVAAAFLLLNAAQTEVNLELGARLLAADRKRKRGPGCDDGA
ncbi:MAG TPA: hypothetical protein VF240_15830 [Pyrinomonadaceae bacterium]